MQSRRGAEVQRNVGALLLLCTSAPLHLCFDPYDCNPDHYSGVHFESWREL